MIVGKIFSWQRITEAEAETVAENDSEYRESVGSQEKWWEKWWEKLHKACVFSSSLGSDRDSMLRTDLALFVHGLLCLGNIFLQIAVNKKNTLK